MSTRRDADADDLERIEVVPASRRRSGHATALERLGGVAILFACWEAGARLGWIDQRSLSAPSSVIDVAWQMTRDGTLQTALWASTVRVLWALAIGAPVGAALALIAGLTRTGDALVDANVQVIRYVPIIALQPLLILWLGVGEVAKISLIAVGVALPVYVNTYAAVRAIDTRYHELADVLHLGPWERMRRMLLPGAAGGFLVGFRYASAVAWLLLIVAEQTNANEGLGRLMGEAQAFLRSDRIVLVVVVYAALGVACDLAIRAAERYVLRWQARR